MNAQFTGMWTLISQHTHYSDGSMKPSRGEKPAGILMYDAHGNMAVQLMRTDEQAAEFTDSSKLETTMAGYQAYFGTYEVDETRNIVRHYVIGSAYFDYRGTVQERQYEFSDDILILKAKSPGENAVPVLVWKRVTGKTQG